MWFLIQRFCICFKHVLYWLHVTKYFIIFNLRFLTKKKEKRRKIGGGFIASHCLAFKMSVSCVLKVGGAAFCLLKLNEFHHQPNLVIFNAISVIVSATITSILIHSPNVAHHHYQASKSKTIWYIHFVWCTKSIYHPWWWATAQPTDHTRPQTIQKNRRKKKH